MKHDGHSQKPHTLESFGITNAAVVHWNLTTPELYTAALQRHEGSLMHLGPLAVDTGKYTGRSPKDKFVVRDATSETKVDWGNVNQPMSVEHFQNLKHKTQTKF